MNEENKCPIWGTDCHDFGPADFDGRHINSPRAGGYYEITGRAVHMVDEFISSDKIVLSRWIYEQNLLGVFPRIDSAVVEEVPNWPVPSVPKRIDYFLQFAELETRGEIANPVMLSEKMCAAATVLSFNELLYLTRQADAMKLLGVMIT